MRASPSATEPWEGHRLTDIGFGVVLGTLNWRSRTKAAGDRNNDMDRQERFHLEVLKVQEFHNTVRYVVLACSLTAGSLGFFISAGWVLTTWLSDTDPPWLKLTLAMLTPTGVFATVTVAVWKWLRAALNRLRDERNQLTVEVSRQPPRQLGEE